MRATMVLRNSVRWRRGWDSNPRTPVKMLLEFQSSAFDRSATSPINDLRKTSRRLRLAARGPARKTAANDKACARGPHASAPAVAAPAAARGAAAWPPCTAAGSSRQGSLWCAAGGAGSFSAGSFSAWLVSGASSPAGIVSGGTLVGALVGLRACGRSCLRARILQPPSSSGSPARHSTAVRNCHHQAHLGNFGKSASPVRAR